MGGEEVRARPSAGGGDVRVSWQTVGGASPAGAWRLILLQCMLLRNPLDLKHADRDSVGPVRACGWVCISNRFHGDAHRPQCEYEGFTMTSSL